VVEARLNKFNDAIASLLKQRQAADDPDNENLLAAIYEAKGMKKEAEAARAKAAEFQGNR
jgi:Flp pilus assembly protein TadD